MTHVLIVDDNDANLYYLETLLTGSGFTTSSARHGAEALTVARRQRPDIVISDLLMPVMDGYTLLRHWRADEQLRHIPFIVYTATYTEPEDEALALNLGADAFILKPAEPEDFLRQLHTIQEDRLQHTVSGKSPLSRPDDEEPPELFKAYSDTLIRKLEEKMLQLEKVNQTLKADIEERERVEEALRRSQRLEVVGRLTGGIAHDFNNFLHVILMNADLIGEAETLPPELTGALDNIVQAVESASDLVRQLLAFSGRQSLQPQVTDVNELIEKTSRLLYLALGKQIALVHNLAAAPVLANVDQGQLESALMNLCVNARDAMPQGGRLQIETCNETLTSGLGDEVERIPPGAYVRITVNDSGSGIREEHLDRVFEPFFTTKPEGGGTGLGLSMVYGFMKQSGGIVTIQSTVGRGTAVSLYLPRALA